MGIMARKLTLETKLARIIAEHGLDAVDAMLRMVREMDRAKKPRVVLKPKAKAEFVKAEGA
jgi:hypothetical protein